MCHLYHQDDLTASHHGDLVPANINPDVGLYRAGAQYRTWLDSLKDEV